MAALTNLGFETAGGSPGQAASWTVTVLSSIEEIDVMTAGVTDGFESGWATTLETAIVPGTNGVAMVLINPISPAPLLAEGFEVGWEGNEFYESELVGEALLFSTFFASGPEGFEGWGHLETVFGGTVAAPVDGFETGWGVTSLETFLDSGNSIARGWSGARDHFAEDFEDSITDTAIVPNTSTGAISYVGHPFSTGYQAQVYNDSGLLPSGYVSNTAYTILVIDANTIALQIGGSTVIPTNDGSGVTYLTEPYEFWTVLLPF